MKNERENQKRLMNLKEAIALVIGVVIGSGVFFKTTVVLKNAGTPYMAILAWSVAGLLTICSGLTMSEISASINKPGGLYAYLTDLYGEKVGFLYGWVQVIVYFPAVLAALAIVFTNQLGTFFNLSPMQLKMAPIILIFALLSVHVVSNAVVGKLQVISTIGKLIPLVAIIVFGLIAGKSGAFSTTTVTGAAGVGTGFGAALLGCLWAYDGWISAANVSGEIENPTKNLPKAIILGISVVIVVYVLFNIAVLKTMDVNAILTSTKTASDASIILFGKVGSAFIGLGILVSVFGALNGYMLAGSRMPLVMSQDRMLPFSDVLSKISPKFNTPINSLVFVSIVSSLYALSGSFDMLTDLVIFILWIFFVMGIAGIFILRKRNKGKSEGYKVPLYPIIPLIGIIGGSYIVENTIVTNPKNSLIGIAITLVGLPVYFYVVNKNKKAAKKEDMAA